MSAKGFRKAYSLVVFVLPIIFSCRASREWIRKIEITHPAEITLMVCYRVEDVRLAEIHKLIDTYNLVHHDEVRIVMENRADVDEYEARIKQFAAANELPDIFMIAACPKNSSLWKSDKLLDFSDIISDFKPSLLCDEALRPYFFAVSQLPLVCYYHPSMLQEASYEKPALNPTELLQQCKRLSDLGITPFALTAPAYTSMACDLLFAMYQARTESENPQEYWRTCLRAWRDIMLMSLADANQTSKQVTNAEYWYGGSAAMMIADAMVDMLGMVPQAFDISDPAGHILYGPVWGFAASDIHDVEKRNMVLPFLEYLESNINTKFLPEAPVQLIGSRALSAQDYVFLQDMLEMYLADPGMLEKLYSLLERLSVL